MGNALGIKGIMGLGKETTYGTAVDVDERLLMISEGINFDYTDVLHDYLHGGAGLPGMERLFEPVSGSFDCYVPYTILNSGEFISADLLIALGMGAVQWQPPTIGCNEITFKDDLDVFGTLAFNKWDTGNVWEVISAMVKSFTLTCSLDKPLVMSTEIAAQDLLIGDTTENRVSDLTSLPTLVPNLIQLRHFVFRIGNQLAAMDDNDEVGISSFTINVNNNLTDHQQTTVAGLHTEPEHPIQPVRNGFREVTLEIVVPRYGNDTFFNHVAADDNLQAEIYATNPATSADEFDISFPNLKIQGDPLAPIAGAEALSQTITFRALKRNAASDLKFTDTGYDDGEMWIETDNGRTEAIF